MSNEHPSERRTILTRARFLELAGAAALTLSAPELAFGRSTSTRLVAAVSGGPDTLDTHTTIAGTDWVSLANIYDGLFMRDYASSALPANTIPGLATSYELSPDGRTYTFHLRSGVQFHDGTPWDADAAVFNFRRWFDKTFKYYYSRANATVNGFIGGVDSYTAPDKSTFKVTLTAPNGGWFDYFTGAPTFFMVSPAAVMKYGNTDFANHGGGTGPFMVKQYTRNVRLVLEANPKYWGGAPGVSQLVIVPVPDDSARVAGLLSGQFQIAQEISPDSIASVDANPSYHVEFAGKPVTFGFTGDMRSGPWHDPLVRQAVSMAINRKGITDKILKGAGVPATQFYGLGNPAFDKSLPVVDPYDPQRAKQILARSGHGKGLHFKFYTSTSAMGVPNPSRVLEQIQSDLDQIGITSEINVSEWTAYLGIWFKGTPPAQGSTVPIYTQAMGWDTNMLLTSYAASTSWPPHGVNYAWYKNPKVDALLAKTKLAHSTAELFADLRAAQRLVLKDRGYIYVFHGRSAYAVKKSLQWIPANTWAQRFSRAKMT
jgi:peptide/nickel transport system substrate-binding protein